MFQFKASRGQRSSRAFHVNMNVYQHPTENARSLLWTGEPSVDLPFPALAHHRFGQLFDSASRPRQRSADVKVQCHHRLLPQASFCGSDMRAAYYEGTALTGSGQNIGLLEYAGFDIADVNTLLRQCENKPEPQLSPAFPPTEAPSPAPRNKAVMIPNRALTLHSVARYGPGRNHRLRVRE